MCCSWSRRGGTRALVHAAHGSNPFAAILNPSQGSQVACLIKGRRPGLHARHGRELHYSTVAFPAHVELNTTGPQQHQHQHQHQHGGCRRGRGSRFGGDHPGHPAHPHPALQPSSPSWLPNLHVDSGFHAVPSRPFQKVGSRKFQGVIVPASAWVPISRVPDVLGLAKFMLYQYHAVDVYV